MLLLAAATGCRCNGPIVMTETGFRVEQTEVDFGRVLENTRAEAQVNVVSTGTGDLTLTLLAEPPFEVQETLELPGGANVPVTVNFLAGNTAVERTFTINGPTGPDGGVRVTLKGTGVRPLECVPSGPCRTSTYVLETHSCSETVLPDNTDCTPTSTCLERGRCLSGQCQGVARSCDDNNTCTIDGCAEGIGCVNAPRTCPPPSAPCRVATCDPGTGCGEAQAQDGTPCGPVDCINANVCAAGQCVTVPTPEGFPCSPATPCQGPGTCQSQVCTRPDAGIMFPELTLPIGGRPPEARPMLLSYAGQLFGQVCGLALPPIRLDGGLEDGGFVDAGFIDGGLGCALFSYTNNGFERFTEAFTDERERAFVHVANSGAFLLDDGGLELRSLGTGRVLTQLPLPGPVHPKGVAFAQREPWLLVQAPDAGSTLWRLTDGGLETLSALDASVQLLALDEASNAWVASSDLAGFVPFDEDGGRLLEPTWTAVAPAVTTTLATAGGVALAGSSQFVASAPDAGVIPSPSWLDDAGVPLRVQERITLMARDRAAVFYRQCPSPLMSCAPQDEQLRVRIFASRTGQVVDDSAVSPPRFDARVVEAAMIDLPGYPLGVVSLVQLHSDAGIASAYLQIAIGSEGELICPLPRDSEVAAAAIGSGYLWAYVSRDGGTWGLEAYPLTGLPVPLSGWPLADGVAGQRRAR